MEKLKNLIKQELELKNFDEKIDFHTVVRDAISAGLTEPDPRIDLRGVDVQRKILILGASYALNDQLELFGDVRYRDADDATVNSPLLSANFDVENSGPLFNLGLRYSF